MRPASPILTYAGVAVVAIGFGVLIFSWSEVAGRTNVALQMPYLFSGGLVGIGLILGGLTLVNVNAKRQDAARRDRQLLQLREVLADIRGLLAGEPVSREVDGSGTPDPSDDPARPPAEAAEGGSDSSDAALAASPVDEPQGGDDLTEPLPTATTGAGS